MKASSVEIRPRTEDDLAACKRLAGAVHARDGYPPRYAEDLVALFTRPAPLAAWVAVRDDELLGHVALHDRTTVAAMQLATDATGIPAGGLIVLTRLLVSPEARRQGIARALIAVALADAQQRGRRVILDVATPLVTAVQLYETLGWVRLGTVTATFPDAEPLDEHVYLSPPD